MTTQTPKNTSYDVVIVGGAMMGASAAWFLSDDKDFDGTVLVVDRDLSYENTSTMHTNSCMRQQFSGDLNVRISQFAADFVKNLPRYMGDDDRVPDLSIRSFGYMYLADNEGFADVLRESREVQVAAGAGTQLMTPEQIKAAYPFYNVDDIVLGSINTVDEGYWDGATVFEWWRRQVERKEPPVRVVLVKFWLLKTCSERQMRGQSILRHPDQFDRGKICNPHSRISVG